MKSKLTREQKLSLMVYELRRKLQMTLREASKEFDLKASDISLLEMGWFNLDGKARAEYMKKQRPAFSCTSGDIFKNI